MRITRYLLCIVIPFFLAACNNSGTGIFYSIKEEQPLENNDTLPDDITVQGMIKHSGFYYVAAGALYRSAVSENQDERIWSVVSPPETSTSAADSAKRSLCVKVVLFNGTIFALYASFDGTKSSLYVLDTAALDADSDPWTIASDASVSDLPDEYVAGVTNTAAGMYLSTRTLQDEAHVYTNYESSDGAVFTSFNLTNQYTSITDADQYGGVTWLISGTMLYNDSGGSFAPQTNTGDPTTVSGFGGLFSSTLLNNDVLFLSSADGNIFVWDGTSWSDPVQVTDTTGNPVELELNDLAEVSVEGDLFVLVGSQNGYFDILLSADFNAATDSIEPVVAGAPPPDDDQPPPPSSADQNYRKTGTLYYASIQFFFVDTVTSTIFAATSVNGLWANYLHTGDDGTFIKKWDPE